MKGGFFYSKNQLIATHLALFYQGCLANQGHISKDDKATGARIKEYLKEIDRLKRQK